MNDHDAGNASTPEDPQGAPLNSDTTQPLTPSPSAPEKRQAGRSLKLLLAPKAPGKQRTGWQRWIKPVSVAVVGVILLAAIGGVVSLVATNNAHSAQQRDQAALDHALVLAQTRYNVPPSRLKPIQVAEQQILAGMDNSYGGYRQAGEKLVKLTGQVNALTHTPPAQARAMTKADLATLSAGVDKLATAGFIEAPGFQKRFQQAQSQFAAATTTPQYFAVDTYALDQLGAVNAFQPTYQRLQDFTKLIQSESTLLNGADGPTSNNLQCAQGLDESFWLDDPLVQVTKPAASAVVTPESQWPASDLNLLRSAASSADFESLNRLLTSQTQQTLANETALLPGVATNLLQQYQANITLMKQYKQDTTTFEQVYAQDQKQAQTVAATPALASYTAFVTTLRQHSDDLQLPLMKAKTSADLETLNKLVAQGQASKTIDPANGIGYPNAYEYADPNSGVGDATGRLANAKTVEDYKLVDDEILMFTANIQAMLTNLKDSTPWSKPHATDTQLMTHYGVMSTRVLVVSLREQAMRLYDNGKFVKAIQVTTGAPDLPSVPGIHCALNHVTNVIFKSPDPPGSPNYYQPTPIHYSMDYSYYGYAVHDAWWRSWFGKYSNLPHYDPAAFNGGSHGCINMGYSNGDALYVFNFAQLGTPIIVY
jgi:lipoprotein-anchoring transpeptidase ErfK/SrfK